MTGAGRLTAERPVGVRWQGTAWAPTVRCRASASPRCAALEAALQSWLRRATCLLSAVSGVQGLVSHGFKDAALWIPPNEPEIRTRLTGWSGAMATYPKFAPAMRNYTASKIMSQVILTISAIDWRCK